MEFCGLIDSPGGVLRELKECANCKGTSRLGTGLCLKCLLRDALIEEPDSGSSKTALSAVLAEVAIADTDRRIGNYEILDEIGCGGMAVIYRARELHSQRIVALKRVLSYHAESDQMLARFRREAETAAGLDHPNIIPVYYVGHSEDGLPFFTMKFASGGSLLQAREAFRREPRRSVSLLVKVAEATQYAHEQGVLHRDLKPSNILLDNRWEPMVSDFGLAKWIESSKDLTRTLTIFGTAGYIAPERVARPGAPITVAADIYSLGAILFELLTGRSPFLGEHALAVIQQAAEKPAPRLRSLAPRLDRDLETICARCLEREPTARYHSAGSLAQDLRNWLEDRPIVARPVSIPSRLWRWSRRNPVVVSMLGAFAAIAAAAVPWGIHSWQLQSAARESTLASRSVAVLPFLDLDNVAPDEALAQSVADSLQEELDRISPARVKKIPSSASAGWKTAEEIRNLGETAKTRAVLTGTERVIDGKKRISLCLRDTATADPVLKRVSETSQEGPTNLIGSDIGKAIDSVLNNKDWPVLLQSKIDPGLRNQLARETIAAGRELMVRYTLPDFERAIDLFRKAIRAEPQSSLAHAYLAMAATSRPHFISDDSFLELGEAEAYEAIRLSPDSKEGHKALAGLFYQTGKFAEALEEALESVESFGLEEEKAHFIGMTLDTLGRPDRALRWHSLALESGGSADGYGLVGDCWVKLGEDTKAVEAYSHAMELYPEFPQGSIGLCHLRLLQGDFDGARELYQNSRWDHGDLGETEQIAAQVEFFARKFDVAEKLYAELSKSDVDGGGSFYGAVSYRSALGRIKQAIGDSISARSLLTHSLETEMAAVKKAPTNPEALYRLAAVESSIGMSDRAIAHLHQAVKSGWIDYRSLAMDPRFDSVREDSRVKAICNDLTLKVAEMRVKLQNLTTEVRRNNR